MLRSSPVERSCPNPPSCIVAIFARQSCASAHSYRAVLGGLNRITVLRARGRQVPARRPFPPNHAGCPRQESNLRTRFRKPLLARLLGSSPNFGAKD